MMTPEEKRQLGWSQVCCICGKCVDAYHNPDPLRDGKENCCDACNRLVMAARRLVFRMPREEQQAYMRMLRDLPYETLRDLLMRS